MASSINNTTTGRISSLNIPTELEDLQYKDPTVKSQESTLGYRELAMKSRSGYEVQEWQHVSNSRK
jgi:hypothetical protein